ncbi:unnamed protein product [Schistosoma turkestanicum]|nr:unnamed protein product [Schistosoma turkestanicum]
MVCNEFLGVDVVDELQSYIERQMRGIVSRKSFSSTPDIGVGKMRVKLTLDRHSANIVSRAVKNLSHELDQVVSQTFNHPDYAKTRIKSIMRDFENTVADLCNQYSKQATMAKNFPSLSSIKLGSVYAWAREQSVAKFNDLQMCPELRKTRLRLCRKLSRLVRLSKSSKQRGQSHPLLVSLRHDLMKIRSRATGKVFIDKPVIMTLPSDTTFVASEKPIIQSKLAVVFEKLADQITDLLLPISHLIPGISIIKHADDAAKCRENLRTQVMLALQGFYSHYEDINEEGNTYEFKQNNSFINRDGDIDDDDPMNGNYDPFDKFESSSDDNDLTGEKLTVHLNPAIIQASLDRYDHFNWNKHKQQQSTSNRSKEHTTEQQSTNNSLRQSTLKSVKLSNLKEKIELIQPTMNNVIDEKPIEANVEVQFNNNHNNNISIESESQLTRTNEHNEEIRRGREEGDNQITDNNHENQYIKSIEHFSKSIKSSHSNSKVSSTSSSGSNSSNANHSSSNSGSSSSSVSSSKSSKIKIKSSSRNNGFTRKRTNRRSLRLHHHHHHHDHYCTPSDNTSCSEGEVLSDSEDEDHHYRHHLTDNDCLDEKEEIVDIREKLELITETDKTTTNNHNNSNNSNPNEDLVRFMEVTTTAATTFPDALQMMNTSNSEIDMTELEIMDEWGLTTTTTATTLSMNRLDTSTTALSDISLPVDKKELKLISIDNEITNLFNESLEFCAKNLHDLILQVENNCHLIGNTNEHKTNNELVQWKICLPPDLEARIERTATAFKEHIDSVLNNLLHTTASNCKSSSNDKRKSHSHQRVSTTAAAARRQQAASRRGSRLRGMLLAYQQDAVKKRMSSTSFD